MKNQGGWVKNFYGSNKEYGYDDLVEEKKASWSRGLLDNIESVAIFNQDSKKTFTLAVPNTEWHQFDRYHSIVSVSAESICYRTARVVQAKILSSHLSMGFVSQKDYKPGFLNTYFYLKAFKENSHLGSIINGDSIGKWLSLILLPDDKVAVQISDRGKVKWQAAHI